MRRCLIAFLAAPAVALVLGAPCAAADPQDDVPYCSGDMTPADDLCRDMPYQVFHGNAPGADPMVPVGVDPTNGSAIDAG